MAIAKRSPHRLKGKIIKLRRGLALYQTHASPFYYARVLDPRTGKYKVRSTKETSSIEARTAAEELAQKISSKDAPAPQEFSFKTYAHRFVQKGQQLADSGERNRNYIRTAKLFLDNDDWGLVRHFGTRDVRELTTRDWQLFIERLNRKRSDLSTSTRNMLMATFRNVLKVARDDGLIDVVPATPKSPSERQPQIVLSVCTSRSRQQGRVQKAASGSETDGQGRPCCQRGRSHRGVV